MSALLDLFDADLTTFDPKDEQRAETFRRQSPLLYIMSALVGVIFLLAAIAELLLTEAAQDRGYTWAGEIYSTFFAVVMLTTFLIFSCLLCIAIVRSYALHKYEARLASKKQREARTGSRS